MNNNHWKKAFSLVLILAFAAISLSACTASEVVVEEEPEVVVEEPTVAPTDVPTVAPTDMPTEEPTPEPVAPESNLTDACVEEYVEGMDYFPDKVSFDFADGVTVEYHGNYKVVEVLSPWPGAEETFRYVLVQCGTPIPEGVNGTVLEVPIDSVVSMSTTFLPGLVELGELESIVGLDSGLFVSSQVVREVIDAGELAEIGSGAEVNVEVALELDPDLIMVTGSGSPEYDAHPVLIEAGLPVGIVAEWVEGSPMARAEWVKNTALFFNKEAEANALFDEMVAVYNETAELAASVEEKPTVFANTPWQGTWYMPGGASYVAVLFEDAGADYLWSENADTGSQFLDFETVFDTAQDADIWVNVNFTDLAGLEAADERFTEFAAFQNGEVYANNARTNANGGNDYWESGLAHPEIVLKDLVKIFHPELLPDWDLYYYQQLQ